MSPQRDRDCSVYLVDLNVWIALAYSKHSHHHACVEWLSTVTAPRSLAFRRATQQGLLRLLATSALTDTYGDEPLSNEQAWGIYDAFVGDHRVTTQFAEPAGLDLQWRQLSSRATASPKTWMDAYLAAFAIAAGLTLVTADQGFAQFEHLDLVLVQR